MYLRTLITELARSGHEIHIFANRWTDSPGMVFHKVDIVPFTSYLSTLTFDRNVKQVLRAAEPRPDCIISLERTTSQDIYRAGEGCHAEWLRIRSMTESWFRRMSFRVNPLHLSMLDIERRLFAETPMIVANSAMVKAQIIGHYAVPEERITIIRNGVDLARFRPGGQGGKELRERLGLGRDKKIVLFAGSGFERKGLGVLFEALALMKGADASVLVVGRGDERRYSALGRKLGIRDRIIFTGPQKSIESYYAAADLFVLPTLYDPFSNATIEAMAAGLPVITTINNGVAELIEDGREGFVMKDLFDSADLASKMAQALAASAEMGSRARKKAEAYPIQDAVAGFLRLIESR